MSEDIPERTLISEAERKRLKRKNETPEDWAIRQEKQQERLRSLRQAHSDQERVKLRECQRKHHASLRENETENKSLIMDFNMSSGLFKILLFMCIVNQSVESLNE